jgi:hypothetical protein
MKVHHPNGCVRSKAGRFQMSLEPDEITCAACRRYVAKYGLQSRSKFPDCPTFDVRAEGKYFTKESGLWGCSLIFRCPCCGRENVHGGLYGRPGAGDGHRVAHCQCWKSGYYIREIADHEHNKQ